MSLALATQNWSREIRALLILGRVSNLPTVWSNCLAGWWLSGGGTLTRLALLCVGGTCLYLGGMFLNDAFDAEFDAQFRKERPIPSGAISLGQVWGWGIGWLVAGVLLLSLLGTPAFIFTLLLTAAILLYDAIHKAVVLAPVLMASCRWLLYLIAGSAAAHGLRGLTIWSGLALAAYVTGLSYLARGERARASLDSWPSWLLAAPVVLAWFANADDFRTRALVLSGALVIWVLYCLRDTFWAPTPSVGRTVSGLLAGICLVDLLAIAGGTIWSGCIFVALFLAALAAQRFIPAT
jgi:4-hydroxybenzoate polyprenyltransferase